MEYSHTYPYELSFIKEDFLWRYISLPKLLSFLENKSIFFSRLDSFEDTLEGLSDKDHHLLSLWTGFDRSKFNPNLGGGMIEHLVNTGEKTLEKIEENRINSQQTQFATCWFMQERESLAMWNLYSDSFGVALKIKANSIFNQFRDEFQKIKSEDWLCATYGAIDYRKISPYDFPEKDTTPPRFNAYKKDIAYEHEKEFRFIVVQNPESEKKLNGFEIDVNKIFNEFEIYLHPRMPEWFQGTIKSVLSSYNVSNRVHNSRIKLR